MTPVTTSEGVVYGADYRLTADGSYTLAVTGTDIAGNDSTVTRSFSAALVSGAGATLSATGGLFGVSLPSGSLPGEGYVIASEAIDGHDLALTGSAGGLSPAWRVTPDASPLARSARVVFAWDPAVAALPAGSVPEIHRWGNGRWVPVESYHDEIRGVIEASVDRLGIFQLRVRDDAGDAGLVHGLQQNYPNPFNGTTQIRYTLAHPAQVEVFILNVRGQRVTTLVDSYEDAGRHAVGWNGRGEDGRRLSSGIYLVALKVDGRVFTRKVLLLQ
jgi:hypothetical protein